MKGSAASMIPQCQFPLFLAALGHGSLYPEERRGAIRGPLGGFEYPDVVYQTLGPVFFLVGLVPGSPRQPSSRTSRDGQSLIGRPLYSSRKQETLFADCRLNALTLCLLESLGLRHAVVGALSAPATDS